MKKLFTTTLATLLLTASFTALAGPKNGKAPGEQDITSIVVGNEDFSILEGLVLFAELEGVLAGEGQFTVFAPTNAAFVDLIGVLASELGQEAAEALLGDKDFVTNVLLYHVTDGRRSSNSLVNKNNPKLVEMLNGDYTTVNSNATITDGSMLTADSVIDTTTSGETYNISASNGVIHVVGAVLVP